MEFSRRRFLRIASGIGLIGLSGYLFRDIMRPPAITAGEKLCLTLLLDVLLPAYDDFPPASGLGIVDKIIDKTGKDHKYRRLTRKGCYWLDAQARSMNANGFDSLNVKQQEQIAGVAAKAPLDTVQRIFFENVWRDAVFFYYAEPFAWKGIGYNGPPQPAGFPDYSRPLLRHI